MECSKCGRVLEDGELVTETLISKMSYIDECVIPIQSLEIVCRRCDKND